MKNNLTQNFSITKLIMLLIAKSRNNYYLFCFSNTSISAEARILIGVSFDGMMPPGKKTISFLNSPNHLLFFITSVLILVEDIQLIMI